MANVEHNALTGASLHEPKGVAAATADTVYVADGAGSGSWTTIGPDSLSGVTQAFNSQLLHVQDEKTAGTNGGSSSVGLNTRTLNTVATNEISGASLASNQITLPAGTYFAIAWAPAVRTGGHQLLLANVTDGTTTLKGTCAHTYQDAGDENMSTSFLTGRFTIGSAKAFSLSHYCSIASSSFGLGRAVGWTSEIYAQILIWKVA